MQAELLTAIRARDSRAFKQMYDSYIRYVYYIVSRHHSDPSNYPDIIQEIFAVIFLKIDTYDEKKGDFQGWLRAISVNMCSKYFRDSKRRIETTPLDTISRQEEPREWGHDQISKDDMQRMLTAMPSGYREVFTLVEIDGFSHSEVSKKLDISAETSRSQLHRAKRWLKEYFSRTHETFLNNAQQTK
jgi:RNA polymerase sigma-70 factor (ECF subfamily)